MISECEKRIRVKGGRGSGRFWLPRGRLKWTTVESIVVTVVLVADVVLFIISCPSVSIAWHMQLIFPQYHIKISWFGDCYNKLITALLLKYSYL